MLLSAEALITLAPVPLIITCHYRPWLHLFTRLSEMAGPARLRRRQLSLRPGTQTGKVTLQLSVPRSVPWGSRGRLLHKEHLTLSLSAKSHL